jgi:1,4-alpha-glucan branching enzyme
MTENEKWRMTDGGWHNDPYLMPYEEHIKRRARLVEETKDRLTGREQENLCDFASGHEFFGLHFRENRWVFREWAPNAKALFLVGDMTDWREEKCL